MKFELICSSRDQQKMTNYIYELRMNDIKVKTEVSLNRFGKESLNYFVYIETVDDLLKMHKAVGEFIVGASDYMDRIEIYDDYRE